jgi:predicted nucleic acid-binding protein
MSKAVEVPRHYWDACLFLDLINVTPGRAETLSRLWDDLLGKEPKALAVTSVLSIAEVAYAAHEKQLHVLNPAALAKIDGFWSPSSPIEMVEIYPGLAFEARRMMRTAVEGGNSLRAHDAIHFAAAFRRGCTHFLTFDEKLYKFDCKFGFAVQEPKSDALPFPIGAGV